MKEDKFLSWLSIPNFICLYNSFQTYKQNVLVSDWDSAYTRTVLFGRCGRSNFLMDTPQFNPSIGSRLFSFGFNFGKVTIIFTAPNSIYEMRFVINNTINHLVVLYVDWWIHNVHQSIYFMLYEIWTVKVKKISTGISNEMELKSVISKLLSEEWDFFSLSNSFY